MTLPAPLFKALNGGRPSFTCPVCQYAGPFRDSAGRWVSKYNSICPQCGSSERVRIEWLAITEALRDARKVRAIHFAPEPSLVARLRPQFEQYELSDFTLPEADHRADLTALPFPDDSFDFLIASHVLEHIQDDISALREIGRVLRPGGIAILPVPTSGDRTVEYDAPKPEEAGHVRRPGADYFDRYTPHFSKVVVRSSESYPAEYQLFSTRIGTDERHPAFVPICYA